MRLNKYLSQCGVASRRKADNLILQGRIKINGQRIRELGVSVDPDEDKVEVDGRRCGQAVAFTYLVLNKPKGYICTHANFEGEKSIFSLLPQEYRHLKIAGRLDKYSEGLVVLSDDGDFIQRLTHPKFRHEKEYEAVINKPLSRNDVKLLLHGVRMTEGLVKFDKIKAVGKNKYSLVLHQGWKRQVRRMFEQVGCRIESLRRVRESKLVLGNIKLGEYHCIERGEVI